MRGAFEFVLRRTAQHIRFPGTSPLFNQCGHSPWAEFLRFKLRAISMDQSLVEMMKQSRWERGSNHVAAWAHLLRTGNATTNLPYYSTIKRLFLPRPSSPLSQNPIPARLVICHFLRRRHLREIDRAVRRRVSAFFAFAVAAVAAAAAIRCMRFLLRGAAGGTLITLPLPP